MILGVFGASGLGREAEIIARKINNTERRWEKIVFVDDNEAVTEVLGTPSYSFAKAQELFPELEVSIAIGEPSTREKVYKRVKESGAGLATLIHPGVYIDGSTEVGEGVTVCEGSTITSCVVLGDNVYVQPHVVIGHDIHIGRHSVIGANVQIGGANEIGEPIFIDSEYETWNMDPKALERAFEIYPDVRLVMLAHLYGTPAKIDEIKEICKEHGAILIEDAAEALGASYKGHKVGRDEDYSVISYNGNKIISGSSGGQILLHDEYSAEKVRKWSTQAREAADWYEHEELGYNYRISNLVAGMIRGQWPHLERHVAQKKAIYERYREGFKDLPVSMNPINEDECEPNYWLSCMLIDRAAMEPTSRSDRGYTYISEPEKSCPSEILEALKAFNAEGRPIWKPMSSQPIFKSYPYITVNGNGRGNSNAYIQGGAKGDVSADIFERGLCLPSDNKMSEEEQDRVIEIVRRCFR